jgi:hypothetical protein
MRSLSSLLGLAALVVVAGCNTSKWGHFKNADTGQRYANETPTADQLVGQINRNAAQISSLTCQDMDLDCKYKVQQFGLRAQMVCQKPRNFRMTANALGSDQADIGSNMNEFWYWIAKGDPYLFHCAYQDLERGVTIPFPFQPDWVIEAFGMAEYPPAPPDHPDRVVPRGNTFELVRESQNAQKQLAKKVTVFNRSGQIVAHVLRNDRDQVVCSAQILDAQNFGGVVVPRKVVLSYPSEQIELRMTLWTDQRYVTVNRQLNSDAVQRLFTRPSIAGIPGYDLAHGPDAASANQVRPAGGYTR